MNGDLHEVYMMPPPRYYIPHGHVCHLQCATYSLKQTSRAWFDCFTFVVHAIGSSTSAHDPPLLIHTSTRGRTLLLYVDDMLIPSDDPQHSLWEAASR